jgi:STAS domain
VPPVPSRATPAAAISASGQPVVGRPPPGGHGRFVVDMARTQFCASAGLGVLVQAHKRALAEGGELRLVMPAGGAVLRIFALTGVDRLIPNFANLAEALAPAPAARRRRHRRRRKPGMRPHADRQPADPEARPSPA